MENVAKIVIKLLKRSLAGLIFMRDAPAGIRALFSGSPYQGR